MKAKVSNIRPGKKRNLIPWLSKPPLLIILTGGLIFWTTRADVNEAWAARASMPTARGYVGCASVGGKIYVIGGGSPYAPYVGTVERYDPTTDTWMTKASFTPRMDVAVAVADNRIYAIGGYDGSDLTTVEVYDPATDAWTGKAPLPTGLVGSVACEVDGKIYVVGAIRGIMDSRFLVYDPSNNIWTELSHEPPWHAGPAMASLNGKVYLTGGNGMDFWEYVPATATWTRLEDMRAQQWDGEAVAFNNHIYVVGGNSQSEHNVVSTVEAYDPINNSWTLKMPMPTPRQACGLAVVGRRIYAIGGAADIVNTMTGVNEEYRPLNCWLEPGSVRGCPEAEVTVAIQVRDGTLLGTAQFSMHWDPTVATFVGVEAIGLSGMTYDENFGGDPATGSLTVS